MERLREIGGLRKCEFFVPHYQRGYRWGEREVRELLEDVWDFAREGAEDSHKGLFYCLQPVVVKKDSDGQKYLLIDGQQRLTTIFLIMKFLKNEDFFEIKYETRPESAGFLREIESKTEGKNIDFWHFLKAHETIQKFFRDDRIDRARFERTLLEHCKVLWYELDENESDEDVFIRLNMGKIPLKEAENIKAMFLSKQNGLDENELKDMAEFWYESEIEARENRDFRYCVLSKVDENDIENKSLSDDILRIEAYLKAIVPHKNEKRYLLDYFYKHYKDNTLNDEYERLKTAVNALSSFASGKGSGKIAREIFHYLGFLTLSGENLSAIYRELEICKDKELFCEKLLQMIKNKTARIKKLEDLGYKKEDKQTLQNILLLFNLEYLIRDENSNDYFKFNRFVLEKWNLEHIYAQNSQSIKAAINAKNNGEIITWLNETKRYIEDENLKDEITNCISQGNFYDELFEKIDEEFKNNGEMHKLSNLTLLDMESNAKIGNKIFSQKAVEIQNLAQQDRLIPIATKKVFEKAFSKGGRNLNRDVFDAKDQKDYLGAINEHLKKYTKATR